MKPINKSEYRGRDLSELSNEELQEVYLALWPHKKDELLNRILQEVHDRWGMDLKGNPNLAIE